MRLFIQPPKVRTFCRGIISLVRQLARIQWRPPTSDRIRGALPQETSMDLLSSASAYKMARNGLSGHNYPPMTIGNLLVARAVSLIQGYIMLLLDVYHLWPFAKRGIPNAQDLKQFVTTHIDIVVFSTLQQNHYFCRLQASGGLTPFADQK
ncbi:hypothetical protein BKA81DRAFT_198489 [Phyllosticta paracitricarpa]